MSNYTMNCASCNDLKQVAPELMVTGLTDEMEDSLRKNTGLNPDLTVVHNNEEDITDMIDCLVGRFGQQVDSYDDCDWKGFMKSFIGNLYGVMRASAASEAGMWEAIDGGGGGVHPDKELVLPAEATYAGYDIPDDWYTSVDATAVYDAGKAEGAVDGIDIGKAAAMCIFGGGDLTRNLPPGTYRYFVLVGTYNYGSSYTGEAWLNYGVESYHWTSTTIGGSQVNNQGSYWFAGSFTLTENSNVRIRCTSEANANMGWGMICIYT